MSNLEREGRSPTQVGTSGGNVPTPTEFACNNSTSSSASQTSMQAEHNYCDYKFYNHNFFYSSHATFLT